RVSSTAYEQVALTHRVVLAQVARGRRKNRDDERAAQLTNEVVSANGSLVQADAPRRAKRGEDDAVDRVDGELGDSQQEEIARAAGERACEPDVARCSPETPRQPTEHHCRTRCGPDAERGGAADADDRPEWRTEHHEDHDPAAQDAVADALGRRRVDEP